jgi:hypothetical protein
MHTVTIHIEVAGARRPEEMNTLGRMEIKIEHLTALTFHENFDYVRIVNVEVHPSHDAPGVNIIYLPTLM